MDLVELAADLRNKGMSLAELAQDAKSPCWSQRYEEAIIAIARLQATVHVDDVRKIFTDDPVHPNAAGAPWMRLAKRGVIVRSGMTRPSTDPKKHRHAYPIWNSAIYRRAS